MVKFYDTNYLIELGSNIFDNLGTKDKIVTSSVCLMEMEHIKTSKNKDDSVKYKTRKATHALDNNLDTIDVVVYDEKIENEIIERGLIPNEPDIKICACAAHLRDEYDLEDLVFYTKDLSCKVIAKKVFGLNIGDDSNKAENIYKGYRIVTGTSDEITEQLSNIDDWNINEYAIIQYEDGTEKEMRFDGEKFVALKLPNSKYIKAKNSLQRCALDILNNTDITIAAILGGFGSGKSFLTTKMGLYCVNEKGNQSKLLGVREVLGEGKEIGYLPGEKDSKIGDFFLPLAQQLDGGEFELESLKLRGVLEMNTPYFMKGTTYNETVMVVDEAEDLNEKQIRLIGTRIGQQSRIFLNGDYKQSVVRATEDNALIKMCNAFKGNPMFGCIYLGEDVRSTTSKLFAHLFEE